MSTNYRGYRFFIDKLELPYAPSELKVTIGSKNQTVELINGSEINILKNPKLTEISFEIELPRGRQYAFANELVAPEVYTDYFEKVMLEKKPVKLVIVRPNPFYGSKSGGKYKNVWRFEGTEMTVSLEGYELKESAENAYDIRVPLKFKEYPKYGKVKRTQHNKVESEDRDVTEVKNYTVKQGDCLWKIAKKFYGKGAKWKTIYDHNKKLIEDTARKYGKKSSSNGWWIYPGTVLKIPVTVKK